MRLTLTLPAALVVKLQRIAEAEHRPPRYQAELLLWDGINYAWDHQEYLDELRAATDEGKKDDENDMGETPTTSEGVPP